MDEVLPSEIFILITFNVKAFTKANSQQIWMNFYYVSQFFSLKMCDSGINFNLDAIHKVLKYGGCRYVKDLNPTRFFPR